MTSSLVPANGMNDMLAAVWNTPKVRCTLPSQERVVPFLSK